ncbi:hypothetical protein NO135_22200, partial [Clostridioides difficile]|nr:hypothetical protein [Clostridioides difficile]
SSVADRHEPASPRDDAERRADDRNRTGRVERDIAGTRRRAPVPAIAIKRRAKVKNPEPLPLPPVR